MILAILQFLPNTPHNLVRADSFSKFQTICGDIEQNSYLAAHAACHATMNGISRIIASHANIDDAESLCEGMERLLTDDTFDALVIPGLIAPTLQDFICDRCRTQSKTRDFRIFFDMPQSAIPEELIRRQKSLPRFASLSWPYLSTITPGRRSAEWLPASCFVAPLALGTAAYLRGTHDMPSLSNDIADTLSQEGIDVLVSKIVDRRHVVALHKHKNTAESPIPKSRFQDAALPAAKKCAPLDETAPISNEDLQFEAELQQTLEIKCTECLHAHPVNNRDLWGALARTVTAVLMHAKMRGTILNYHVRCDEETASWGTPEAPVVEILIEYPKRVRTVKFNVSQN